MGGTPPPPVFNIAFSSVYHNADGWMLFFKRKLPLIYWPSPALLVHILETQKRAQVRPTLFNIWTIWSMDRISVEPQVWTSFLRCHYLKIGPHKCTISAYIREAQQSGFTILVYCNKLMSSNIPVWLIYRLIHHWLFFPGYFVPA
jgi:hypothetical protein